MIACLWQLWVLEMFCIDSKVETQTACGACSGIRKSPPTLRGAIRDIVPGVVLHYTECAIQVASRPREGIIPPEQVCCTNIEPHFCPLADPGAIKKEA